jgi:Tfp pilus assembly protein PilN
VRAVNLIPADQRGGKARGPARSEGGAYAVLALLGGLAVCALLYGIANHQVSTRTAQANALAAETQRSQARAAQLAPYTSFIALREQRTQAVLGIVNSRFDWAHAMHELGRVLPLGTSISALSGTVGSATATTAAAAGKPGATGTSATPPGSVPTFTITGCSISQSEVALTLDRLRLIDGVSEVTLTSSAKTANAGSGATGGACVGGDPSYTAVVSFAPLPATSAVSSSTTQTTALSSGGAR